MTDLRRIQLVTAALIGERPEPILAARIAANLADANPPVFALLPPRLSLLVMLATGPLPEELSELRQSDVRLMGRT